MFVAELSLYLRHDYKQTNYYNCHFPVGRHGMRPAMGEKALHACTIPRCSNSFMARGRGVEDTKPQQQ
jgi:hypothetical protein